MNNPLYFPGDEDSAKLNCCLYSNNCQAYNQVRPLDTCSQYSPPFFGKLNFCTHKLKNSYSYTNQYDFYTTFNVLFVFTAFGFGDPHIKTLDRLEYDYNGIGEYWLLMSSKMSIQVRSQIAWDTSGNPVNASVFAACGIQVPENPGQNVSDRVFVAMDASRTGTLLEL